MTIKEDKVMYVQHDRGKGCEHEGRNFGGNGGCGRGNNNEETNELAKLAWMRPQSWKRWSFKLSKC